MRNLAGRFRNIRVKMKGGRSRIQRAMVLASGKLRFVKNISRSRSSAPRHKTTKHHRIGGYHLARRRYFSRHHRSGKSITAGVEKLAKVGALLGPVIIHGLSGESGRQKMIYILRDYTGINVDHGGKWEAGNLVNGWGPFVGVTVGAAIAHKIIGLVRRL